SNLGARGTIPAVPTVHSPWPGCDPPSFRLLSILFFALGAFAGTVQMVAQQAGSELSGRQGRQVYEVVVVAGRSFVARRRPGRRAIGISAASVSDVRGAMRRTA